MASFVTIFPQQIEFLEADPLAVDLRDSTPRSVQRLLGTDRKVVIVEPLPTAPMQPVHCLEQADWIEDCRFVHGGEVIWLEELYRELAEQEERAALLRRLLLILGG